MMEDATDKVLDTVKPEVSELLQKLCSWAVVSMLNFHPRKEGMPPTLVFKTEENSSYQVQADPHGHATLDEIFRTAREQLERIGETETVQGYALIVDSFEDVEGLPTICPVDENGETYPDDQPTIFVYLGERDNEQGVFVVQAYKGRPIRGGATPVDAPLIRCGPASMLCPDAERGV